MLSQPFWLGLIQLDWDTAADGTKVTKWFGKWLCEGTTEYNKNDDCYKITFSGELKE